MPGMPPRKIDHIFQCLSVFLTFCPLSLLEKTSHLVCLPGKQASSFQKKASASDQPTGSVLLLTTIVSLIEFVRVLIMSALLTMPLMCWRVHAAPRQFPLTPNYLLREPLARSLLITHGYTEGAHSDGGRGRLSGPPIRLAPPALHARARPAM